jgi:hypothetical protein
MNIFQMMQLLCMLGGSVLGAVLGWGYHPVAAVGGFFAGCLLGWLIGPFVGFLALGFIHLECLLLRRFEKDSSKDGGGGPPP